MNLLDRSRTALQLSRRLERLTVDQQTSWTEKLQTIRQTTTQADQLLGEAVRLGDRDNRVRAHKVRQAYDAISKVKWRLRDLWEH